MASLTLALSSCLKTDDNCCVAPYEPYFIAQRNGVQVYGIPASAKVGTDSIAVIGKGNDAGIRMHIKFNGKGVYTLQGNQAKYFTRLGNDTVSRYNVNTASASSLEVTQYDSVAKIITGKFTLNFKKTYSKGGATYPDSVRFSNGQFSVPLPR